MGRKSKHLMKKERSVPLRWLLVGTAFVTLLTVAAIGGYRGLTAGKGSDRVVDSESNGGRAASETPSPMISAGEKEADTSRARQLAGVSNGKEESVKAQEPGQADYEQYCGACHGAKGEGATASALAGSALSTADIVSATAEGVAGMPGYKGILQDEQMKAIASYIRGLE